MALSFWSWTYTQITAKDWFLMAVLQWTWKRSKLLQTCLIAYRIAQYVSDCHVVFSVKVFRLTAANWLSSIEYFPGRTYGVFPAQRTNPTDGFWSVSGYPRQDTIADLSPPSQHLVQHVLVIIIFIFPIDLSYTRKLMGGWCPCTSRSITW